MGFSGWSEAALDFYDGLEEDNSKAYWTAHKAIYDQSVLGPMTELGEELSPEFGEAKIFRPYRDVRFSADKSPYKTGIGAVIGFGYVQFSASGLAAGSGMHQMAPDQIARYRQAVAEDLTGHELERVIEAITKEGYEVHGRDPLKTTPRGYPADHPRIDLLRNKGLVAWQEWPIEPWLSTAAAKDKVAEFFRVSQPLDEWLENHVGPSDVPESRRR
ncbi:MAG TPA: DUF2461 domain-containing protein [Streptosporangiaceae bacterium]|nr:DUF2461 domain-containing protein [Streptosporangiaceae bacterium]